MFDIAGSDFPIVQCGCGLKGCLDNYLSGRGLETIYNYCSNQKSPAKEITLLYQQGNPQAKQAVTIYTQLLSSALGSMINSFDPQVVVFGGGLSNFIELYDLISALLPEYTLPNTPLPPFTTGKVW